MKKIVLSLVAVSLILFSGCAANEPASSSNTAPQRIILEQSEKMSAITVSAAAEVEKEPDVAYANVEVITYAKASKDAQKDNADKMQDVITELTKYGISKDDMETANFTLSPVYDWVNNRQVLSKYECRNSLKLTIRDIESVGEVLDVAGQNGANRIYGVSFSLVDKKAAENEALAQAVENAKLRAQVMADSAGVTLGKAVSISESGYSSPVEPWVEYERAAADKSEAVSTQITPGNMTITANVTVSFEIE
ncbi:MAG: SIMPL domain-containing protein [Christensenellales bacterium]